MSGTGRLAEKVAIISGGATGMGEQHTRAFVAEGAQVIIGDVLDDKGKALAEELGDAVAYQPLDVRDEESWAVAVRAAREAFGGLDVLVNNAGILRTGTVGRTSTAVYREVVAVNQDGVFFGMRAAAPLMAAGGGGSIVNISSESGMIGKGGLFAYSATKWAVRGMTKCAARDLGRHGIRVNSVHPGGVLTRMIDRPELAGFDPADFYGAMPIPRPARRREISPLVVYLASDDSSYVTAAEFVIDGGLTSGNDVPLDEDATAWVVPAPE